VAHGIVLPRGLGPLSPVDSSRTGRRRLRKTVFEDLDWYQTVKKYEAALRMVPVSAIALCDGILATASRRCMGSGRLFPALAGCSGSGLAPI
jgi:hypothetical protein